jgi:hypothetical protein
MSSISSATGSVYCGAASSIQLPNSSAVYGDAHKAMRRSEGLAAMRQLPSGVVGESMTADRKAATVGMAARGGARYRRRNRRSKRWKENGRQKDDGNEPAATSPPCVDSKARGPDCCEKKRT